MSGRAHLTLVATPIGNLGDLAPRAVEALHSADVIAAEDTRRARALLSHASVPGGGRLRSVRAANEREAARELVEELRGGRSVAYVTDAGMPAISDPGAVLVGAVLDAGFEVDCIPGPSALLTALVLSGLPTDRFVFEGFLPRKGTRRRDRVGEIAAERRTVVLYEAPRRAAATLAELAEACGDERPAAVARELTKLHQSVWRGPLGQAAQALGDETRGELVVVVGAAPGREVDDAELEAALDDALAGGASVRDAAAAVGRRFGVGRRRAYEVALRRRPR